jgi:hypothetical protein
MQYELVLQFALAPRDVTRFDRIARLEEQLTHERGPYRVEGCDCALGSISIRLVTDDPRAAYESIRGKMPDSCPCNVQTKEMAREGASA